MVRALCHRGAIDQPLATTTEPESPGILKPHMPRPCSRECDLESLGWSHGIHLDFKEQNPSKKSVLGIFIVNFRELGDIYPEDFVIP